MTRKGIGSASPVLTVVLALAVVVGGAVVLIRAFGGTNRTLRPAVAPTYSAQSPQPSQTTTPTPEPSPTGTENIAGTLVPAPPAEYDFGTEDFGGSLVSARFERHLLYSSLASDPAALAQKASDIYDYYLSAMQSRGWTLVDSSPVHSLSNPDEPQGVEGGGQEWHLGDQHAVVLFVKNWTQFDNRGWQLNLLVTVLR